MPTIFFLRRHEAPNRLRFCHFSHAVFADEILPDLLPIRPLLPRHLAVPLFASTYCYPFVAVARAISFGAVTLLKLERSFGKVQCRIRSSSRPGFPFLRKRLSDL